jgi:hypothetical protein
MDNKDNAVTLSKNKDSDLMAGVKIKTADNDTLRYYIYKAVTIEGAAPAATPAAAANVTTEAAPAAENKTVEAAAAVAAPVEAAKENITEAAKTVEAAKENITEAANKTAEAAEKTAEKATPGFESIFAITGLLAVAYLVLGRRE